MCYALEINGPSWPSQIPQGRQHYYSHSLEEETNIKKSRDLAQIFMTRGRLHLSPEKMAQGHKEYEDSEDGLKANPMCLSMTESHRRACPLWLEMAGVKVKEGGHPQ